MAEAIAALSLAGNIIQVVDFGLKVVSKCKEVHREGTTINIRDLEDMSTHLASLTGHLNCSMQNAPQPLTREDQELKGLSVKCSKLAAELQDELCKVSSHKRRRG